jgi:putative transcriptional regulator
MSRLKLIRDLLGLTQESLGQIMGCVQGNVTAYERALSPRSIPHRRAAMLIAYAQSKGIALSFDHIYGEAPLPADEATTDV